MQKVAELLRLSKLEARISADQMEILCRCLGKNDTDKSLRNLVPSPQVQLTSGRSTVV